MVGMGNPLRSDAKKRRQALLDAAAEIFAEQGYGAPLDSIAVRAGVGQGTLYRNFADRDELMAALITRDLSEIEEALHETAPVDHPIAMIDFMAECSVVNPLLAEYWTVLSPESPRYSECEERWMALANRGLAEAKAAGRLRQDFSTDDFCMVGIMLRAIRFGSDEAERRLTKQRVMTLLKEGIVP